MTFRYPLRLDDDPASQFPPATLALNNPDGLLAVGGDLSIERLLNAYAGGIFPWYSAGQPILWWSPDPRMVFRTNGVHLSSRFRRTLRKSRWVISADTAFEQVVRSCAQSPRPGQDGTWITAEMQDAYLGLHRAGHAHSVEVWDGQTLVGGIYGVAIGRMFFGESMFSGRSGGSKVALAAAALRLHHWDYPLIDAQVENPHLLRMGAEHWERQRFIEEVSRLVQLNEPACSWNERFGVMQVQELLSEGGV